MNEIDSIATSIKELEGADLMKVLKVVVGELDKKMKASKSKPKTKKEGSMPKGKVPPQLHRPRAWVEFTLKHAQENGWASFIISQTKKNKETGEKETEETEMPASVLHNGVYVYEDSITEKNPDGKKMIHKDAMSLSKSYWTVKTEEGTHQELYNEFMASYEPPSSDSEQEEEEEKEEEAEKAEPVMEKKASKKMAEEKEAEKRAEKEKKEAEKKAEKEKKEAEKKAEKEKKEAEKKAEKEKKEAEKKVEKVKVEKVKEVKVKEEKKEKKENPKAPIKVKKVEKKVEKEEWSCPEDGQIYPWVFNGKAYVRNSDNEVWEATSDNQMGEWSGVYRPEEGRLDDSVEAPVFEDE